MLSSLGSSARWHAYEALQYFTSDDMNELRHAATATGVAAEMLLKLFIGRTSITLLADRGHQDSLLLLAGHPSVSNQSLSTFRSIGAAQAFTLAKKMGLTLSGGAEQFSPFSVRNSSAHLASVEHRELAGAVEQLAALAKTMFDHLNVDPESFWDSKHMSMVEQIITEKFNRDEARYLAKIREATARFAILDDILDKTALDVLRATRRPRTSLLFAEGSAEEVEFTCPACKSTGQITYCIEDEGTIQYEPDGFHWMEQTAAPEFFECPVCQLELDAEDMLWLPEAADYVPDGRLIEEDELMHSQYDEDMWRDR